MIKKILVALDNSSYADKVMTQAVELAQNENALLFSLAVIENAYAVDAGETDPIAIQTHDYWKSSLQQVLDKCQKIADEKGAYVTSKILKGNAAETIIKYAEQEGIDLIVLGHLGKNAASGFLIGSVAQKVAAYSKCSVFIVK